MTTHIYHMLYNFSNARDYLLQSKYIFICVIKAAEHSRIVIIMNIFNATRPFSHKIYVK